MNLTPALSNSTNAQCSAKERKLFKAADLRIKTVNTQSKRMILSLIFDLY
jgi:hypothetical protein